MDERQNGVRMVSVLEHLKKYKIILASNSPRRRELLAKLDIDFHVRATENIDESYPRNMSVTNVPQYISQKKALAQRDIMHEDELVIAADTIVAVRNIVLGKPKSDAEACKMLALLSGRTHRVITGVTVMTLKRMETFSTVSRVRFADLSKEEIEYYVSNYHPTDKAGAYGVQEWIGMIGVTELSGSYFNVMGLPVQMLYDKLKTF